ncbi:DUF3040 domain-containing protein [Pseudonocardia sp. GCM10023141]|uniref:DUF3040 domain-containing protein n=1 Tax=Pseudonocardia sp. GCM10023141 TaxID=3252653 RepID=UPI00360F4CFF
MLSERERRILARIERHLVESDPDLARLFAGHLRAYRSTSISGAHTLMLVAGLVMLVAGSLLAVIPIAITGMVVSVFALFVAHTRPQRLGNAGFA